MKILTPGQYPSLPKWPSVFVTGKPVTPEQAKEIMFRTDANFQGAPTSYLHGNDRQFEEHCIKVFGWEVFNKAHKASWGLGEIRETQGEAAFEAALGKLMPDAYFGEGKYNSLYDVSAAWRREMDIIPAEYVYNSYLTSSYIGGPTGWCHQDGKIFVDGHNYGKWPSVENIVNDWTLLVGAFPFLDLACTLHDAESCEDAHPLCTIVVRDGAVVVCEYDETLHTEPRPPCRDEMDEMAPMLLGLQTGSFAYERGWPVSWVMEFGGKSSAAMKKVAPWLFST